MSIKKAYHGFKIDKILDSSKWILGIGTLVLVYFVFADFKFRDAPHIAATRYPAITLAISFLIIKYLYKGNSTKWVFPLYHAFLFSLILMQLAIISMDLNNDFFHSAISGTIVVVFIIALIMRANTFSALLILIFPFLLFSIAIVLVSSPENNRIIELANPIAMVVAAFVMNQVNENLRFKEFRAKKMLEAEQEKTSQLLIQEQRLNDEISMQNTELELQKNEVELINANLQDSLNYAQQLQNAMLTGTKVIQHFFPNHFLFFKPKDTVSGDFYWAKQSNGNLYFAIADATGHGVPAAFLSILGITYLNNILKEIPDASPAEVLENLRQRIIENFGIDEGGIKDGIDMALCKWNPSVNTLEFSGAMRPLFVLKNNEITKIDADRCPIGYYPKSIAFTNKVVPLEPGNCVYLFTDGYSDQFDANNTKKYNLKNFKSLLSRASKESTDRQLEILDEEFTKWKGNTSQIDDILVLGIKF